MDGGTYRSLEFSGSLIDALAMPDRIVFANMSTELGAKCGLLAVDATTTGFLAAETRARGPFTAIAPHAPRYEREVVIDVSELAPQVACHPRVDHVRPIGELLGLPIDQVFVGTCT